tara:strand:+ start:107 stop:256 length:150 start_codon:yes stop_codon:yes gene_type:complete
MKVKLNIAVGINGESHAKGATVEVSKDMGMALVISNKAVEVKAKAEKKK